MDYLDTYKSRVLKGTNSTKERLEKDIEISFEKYLNETPTCKEIPITNINQLPNLDIMSKELVSITDISNADIKAQDQKNLLVRKNCNIDVGCYVHFDNSFWIIVFKEHKMMSTYNKFIIKKCNQIFSYKYKGITYKLPVTVDNLTLYSDGIQDIRYTSAGDSKRMITFGTNPISNNIDIGTRVMFTNKTTFRVTNLNDYEFNGSYTGSNGLLKALCLQTALIGEDDLENNTAWNPESTPEDIPEDNKIKGDKFIYMGAKNKYNIVYANNQIEWLLDNQYVFCNVISQSDNSCALESKPLANYVGANVILIARDKISKKVIDMKTIMVRG